MDCKGWRLLLSVAVLVLVVGAPMVRSALAQDRAGEFGPADQAPRPPEEARSPVLDPERGLPSSEACEMVRLVIALLDAGRPEPQRWGAATLLGRKLQHVATVPVLEHVALQHHESRRLRIEAIQALGVIASPKAVDALIRVLAATEGEEWESVGSAVDRRLSRLVFGRKRWGPRLTATDYEKIWHDGQADTDLRARVESLWLIVE